VQVAEYPGLQRGYMRLVRFTERLDRRALIHLVFILVLGFAVYINSLSGEFMWDDHELIENNVYLKHWSNIPRIFTESISAGAGIESRSYRPLQMLSYMIDYSLYGLKAGGYHLSNILFHLAVALSIYWFTTLLFQNRIISLVAGVLFAVHPVHNGVVAYIAGRADSLSMLFMLLCFIFYIKEQKYDRFSVRLSILAVVSFFLALLSREHAVILPALLLLYHFTFRQKMRFYKFLPIIAVDVLYIILRISTFRHFLYASYCPTSVVQRLPGFFVALTNYIRLLVIPFNLHMEYGDKLFHWSYPKAVIGIAIFLLSLLYAFRKKAADKLVLFSFLWFFISLIPFANVVYISAYMAEHWLYLPSFGFCLFVGGITEYFYERSRYGRGLTMIVSILLLAFYSHLAVMQSIYWCDPIKFYKRTLRYAPWSPRAYSNLGIKYRELGKNREAIELFKKAVEIKPLEAGGYSNLGFAYYQAGDNDKAIEMYEKALRLDPMHAKTYNNFAIAYESLGEYEKAIRLYRRAIEINPNYAIAYYNLGNTYHDMGEHEKAIEEYRKAVRLNPDHGSTYYNLGLSLQYLGDNEAAATFYKRALRLRPKDAKIYNNLAIVYQRLGRYEDAIKAYKSAITLKPYLIEAHYNLGNTYRQMGRNDKAIDSYLKAIELNPYFDGAYYNLGNTYRDIGNKKRAIAMYMKATAARPDFAEAHFNLAEMYVDAGRYKDAIESYKRALELKPDNPNIHDKLAAVYFLQKEYDLAIHHCDKAMELGVSKPVVLEQLKPYRNKK